MVSAQRLPLAVKDELVIPGEGVAYTLSRIAGVRILANGEIAVLSPPEQTVTIFSASGVFDHSLGRRGSGPGELTSPAFLGSTVGDTLWIWDPSLARISLFLPSGRFVRSLPVPASGQGVLLSDGAIGVMPLQAYGAGDSRNPVVEITRWGADQKRERTILRMPFPRRVIRFERGGGSIVGKQPFEDGPLVQPAEDGRGFVIVDRTVLTGRGAPSFGVTWVTEKGDTSFSVRIPYVPQPVTPEDISAAVGYLVGSQGTEPGLESRIKSVLFVPSHLPTVSGVSIGQDGALWLRREESTGPTVRWTILSSSGHVRGEVLLPSEMVVRATLKDIVFGVMTDSLGVPQLHRYRFKGEP